MLVSTKRAPFLSCIALTMLGLAVAAAIPSARAAELHASDDRSQIKAIEEKLGQLVDPAEVRRYYADDAVLFDALAPGLVKGAAAIEKSFAAQLRGVRSVNTTFLHEDTAISGSLAVVYSLQAIRVSMMDGTERRIVCRVSDIYRKQGVEWRIAHQHISYPIDPVSGQAQFALTPQP